MTFRTWTGFDDWPKREDLLEEDAAHEQEEPENVTVTGLSVTFPNPLWRADGDQ